MNKIIIFAAAGAAIAAYLITRRRSLQVTPAPVMAYPRKTQKHLTTVFSKAKKYGRHDGEIQA